MKQIVFAALLSASLGAASAATLPYSFVDQSGGLVNMGAMRSVDFENISGGRVKTVGNGAGGNYYWPDSGGVMYSHIISAPWFAASWARVGTYRYINVNQAVSITCANNVMQVGWFGAGAEDIADAGCSYFVVIKANSVPR